MSRATASAPTSAEQSNVILDGQFAGEIAVDGSIWVVYGYRVYQVSGWRVTADRRVIATVPGSPMPQLLEIGRDVFASEREALRQVMDDIDHMRRFYDDLAERAVKRLDAIKQEPKR